MKPDQLSRRRLLCIAPISAFALFGHSKVSAHHGWSSFDIERPLYVEGTIRAVRWQNPHAELDIDLKPALSLPTDLAKRQAPAQSQSVDGAAILAKARLPSNPAKSWTIELAPLLRVEAWKVTRPATGAAVAAIGYTLPGEKSAIMRVEYLLLDGKIYGLRSSPV